VRRLASDGAAVAFTYFNWEEKAQRLASEIETAGGKALPTKADSASAEDIRATVNQVVKQFGEIDIFVNNAGIMIRGTIDSYGLEDFDRMLAINVRAAFFGIQAASQTMKDGGRIILIGSNTAVRTAFPGSSVYSMTKAALTGLVRGPRSISLPDDYGQ
jgi:3-oxoacyl-[acyl-carrier protein] reductase